MQIGSRFGERELLRKYVHIGGCEFSSKRFRVRDAPKRTKSPELSSAEEAILQLRDRRK